MFSGRPKSMPAAVATACLGLAVCAASLPAAANAEGNPGCYYADGWRADTSEDGIEVWYFHEPATQSKPDQVTAIVRMKDGTVNSQIAAIDAGQQVHRFGFPGIDKSAVQEVLLNSGAGQCFVTGP